MKDKVKVYISNLKNKAEQLGLLTEETFIKLQNVNLFNPSATDIKLINEELHRIFEGVNDPLVSEWLNAIDKIENKEVE